jgi:hypothetical protein
MNANPPGIYTLAARMLSFTGQSPNNQEYVVPLCLRVRYQTRLLDLSPEDLTESVPQLRASTLSP